VSTADNSEPKPLQYAHFTQAYFNTIYKLNFTEHITVKYKYASECSQSIE